MSERNAFQQLVDRDLSGLQWNEGRKNKVLLAMDEERRPIYMKKKLSGIMAVAIVLCMLSGVALAATLVYSQRFMQAEKADALLAEQYGITADMLSFFSRTNEGDVYRYKSLPDFAGMPGDYMVNAATGEAVWQFEGPEGSGWDATKLNEILRRCQVMGGYGEVVTEAQTAAAALGLAKREDIHFDKAEIEDRQAACAANEAKAQALARISLEEAEALARAAIQAQYGLTAAQMQQMEFVMESTYYGMLAETPVVEPYFWLNQQKDGWVEDDGVYIVVVNVLDGSIEEIRYDTGLLGNG